MATRQASAKLDKFLNGLVFRDHFDREQLVSQKLKDILIAPVKEITLLDPAEGIEYEEAVKLLEKNGVKMVEVS
jgi:hypothetical protein